MGIRQEFQALLESKTKEELVEIVQVLYQEHSRMHGMIAAQTELIGVLGTAMAVAIDCEDIGKEAKACLDSVTVPSVRLLLFIEALASNDENSDVQVGFADEGPEGSVAINPMEGNITAMLDALGKEGSHKSSGTCGGEGKAAQ